MNPKRPDETRDFRSGFVITSTDSAKDLDLCGSVPKLVKLEPTRLCSPTGPQVARSPDLIQLHLTGTKETFGPAWSVQFRSRFKRVLPRSPGAQRALSKLDLWSSQVQLGTPLGGFKHRRSITEGAVAKWVSEFIFLILKFLLALHANSEKYELNQVGKRKGP